MSKKIWLIIGVVCIIIGAGLFSCVMSIFDWDFNKLNTVEYETKTLEIANEFENIKIDSRAADISLEIAPDNVCKAVYTEEEKYGYNVYVENNTLNILLEDTREWKDYVNINSNQSQITVYLPKSEFADINLKNSTGDITLQEISCNNINIALSTGDITLKNTTAKEKMSLQTSTGDILFEDCDAFEIFADCSTGDINGTLLTGKIFFAKTSTGDVSVPNTASGGNCELQTSTGDINITIK